VPETATSLVALEISAREVKSGWWAVSVSCGPVEVFACQLQATDTYEATGRGISVFADRFRRALDDGQGA
jgi:hypothetical protein